jgi:hypothetical protein
MLHMGSTSRVGKVSSYHHYKRKQDFLCSQYNDIFRNPDLIAIPALDRQDSLVALVPTLLYIPSLPSHLHTVHISPPTRTAIFRPLTRSDASEFKGTIVFGLEGV